MLFLKSILMVPLRMIQRALLLHPAYWSSPTIILSNLSARGRWFLTPVGLFVLLMLLTVAGSAWSDLNENGNGLAIIVTIIVSLVALRVGYGVFLRHQRKKRLAAISAGAADGSAVGDAERSSKSQDYYRQSRRPGLREERSRVSENSAGGATAFSHGDVGGTAPAGYVPVSSRPAGYVPVGNVDSNGSENAETDARQAVSDGDDMFDD